MKLIDEAGVLKFTEVPGPLLKVIDDEVYEFMRDRIGMSGTYCDDCIREIVFRQIVKLALTGFNSDSFDAAELNWNTDGDPLPCTRHTDDV